MKFLLLNTKFQDCKLKIASRKHEHLTIKYKHSKFKIILAVNQNFEIENLKSTLKFEISILITQNFDF